MTARAMLVPDSCSVEGSATKRVRTYLLSVLLAILIFNKVEHAALGVLLQSIKADLHITDTQLGLLSGIAFTLFYAVMGLPIARWADAGNRITILSLATVLQCGALVASGWAATFLELLVVRIAVAIGEAGCVPPSNSLIADYFSRAERPRATSIYMLGYPLSAVLGYFLAGWLSTRYGWRNTFALLGLPGLALAALAYLTLKEPRDLSQREDFRVQRGNFDLTGSTGASAPPSWQELCRALWTNRTYRHLVLGYSLLTFFGIGTILWTPTYFVRSYGMHTEELGVWLAIIWGLGGSLGAYCAGDWASRRAAGNESLQIKVLAIVFALSGLCAVAIYLSSHRNLSFALLAVIAAVNYGTAGPLFATIQTLVPERMRATAVAVTYLCTNLIGVGLGPLAVGALSDRLHPIVGQDSLRCALLALCPGYLWAAWHLWHASSTVAADLKEQTP